MNTATAQESEPVETQSSFQDSNDFVYRSVSKAAIASLVFAILGLSAYLFIPFIIFPVIAVGFGLVALASFREYPEELTGKMAAKIGLALGAICLISSVIMHTYIYATEVPDGYQRISYGALKPNNRTPLPFAEKAMEYDGEKVFLKGYVRPGAKKRKLKEFILVGDFGDCCFGGNPEITDVVAIRILNEGKTVDYGLGLRRIGGTFRLNQGTKRTNDKDIPQVFYEIEADHVR
jgi:hypothetical protein